MFQIYNKEHNNLLDIYATLIVHRFRKRRNKIKYSMDLNIAKCISNNQANNAVKSKFDTKTSIQAAASPPKFNIPLLKIPGGATLENAQAAEPNKSPTELNKFLIKKLQEKHSSNNDLCGKNTEFVLPLLSSPAKNKIAVKYELPVFQSQAEHSNMCRLTTAISKLDVQENSCKDDISSVSSLPVTIDLTTALATKFETPQGTPTRDLMKIRQNDEVLDFEIPFIDCDRQDLANKQKLLLPVSNEYCVRDVSQLVLQHSLAAPSAVGRFLSANSKDYLHPLPLKCFTAQFRETQTKHTIEPFRFDTQSPDDIVLLALAKYQRRHYN